MPARKRARLGLTRTFQTSRLFLGLTVEDNLYLAVLGVRDGHLRPVRLPGRDVPMRERARELAERVGPRGAARDAGRARSRTASSASSRSGWRGPASRS